MGTATLHDNKLSIVGFISRKLWFGYEKVLKLYRRLASICIQK